MMWCYTPNAERRVGATWSGPVAGTGLALGMLLVAVPRDAAAQRPRLESVEILIAQPGTNRTLKVDPKSLSLESRTVAALAGDDVRELLRTTGVQPDGEGIEALYRLNPSLRSPIVPRNMMLNLPMVRGPESVQRALAGGYSAFITLDTVRKLAFLDGVETLTRLTAQIETSPAARETMRLRTLARAIAVGLRARTRPVSPEMLDVLTANVDVANAVLRTAQRAGRHLNAAEVDRLTAIADDLELRSRYWTDTYAGPSSMAPYARVGVRVYTLKARTAGSESVVDGLRVYWIERSLYGTRSPNAMPRRSSPAADSLDEADYVIWAAVPGDTTRKSVTEVLGRARVRKVCDAAATSDTTKVCYQKIELTVLP